MIKLEDLNLRKLNKHDLNTLVSWARKEGWNPGENDFNVFWETDPDGFYGFYFENNLIAGGAVISYNNEYGFMGLFIVHPDFRGQGIGNKLWYLRRDILIGRLNENAIIGMDGVVDMQPFYEKGGFEIAFRDERYESIGQKANISNKISGVESTDFDQITNYDLRCFGFSRTDFLKNWLSMPKSKSFKFKAVNRVGGYAVIREVDSGFKIGPLFADNDEIAEELYKACLNSAVGELIYLDIPLTNKGAIDLVKKYEGRYVFECARMYYGKGERPDMSRVYGITTFELG